MQLSGENRGCHQFVHTKAYYKISAIYNKCGNCQLTADIKKFPSDTAVVSTATKATPPTIEDAMCTRKFCRSDNLTLPATSHPSPRPSVPLTIHSHSKYYICQCFARRDPKPTSNYTPVQQS